MLNDAFAAFLHALPLILGGLVCVVALVGFWRGLSLRPHDPEDRPPNPRSAAEAWLDQKWGPAPRWWRRLFGRGE